MENTMKKRIEMMIKRIDERMESLEYRIANCKDQDYKQTLENCMKIAISDKKELVEELNTL